jgi:hypothetical protein
VRARLKDTALQSALSDIDSCADAERALETAMLEPRFQEFADEVSPCSLRLERLASATTTRPRAEGECVSHRWLRC